MANTLYVFQVSAAGHNPVVAGDKRLTLRNIIRLFTGILSGQRLGAIGSGLSVRADYSAVKASGTCTFAALANNDTVTVNGKVLTAKTSGAVAASHEFNLGASDTAAAANCAALVNASADTALANIVTAASLLGVVTFSAFTGGLMGNAITLASSNGTRAAVSAARLASGAATSASFVF